MKEGKILAIIIIIIVVVMAFGYAGIVLYKYGMLKSIRDTLMAYNESENYKYDNGEIVCYYKDGVAKWVSTSLKYELWSWTDGNVLYTSGSKVEDPDSMINSRLNLNLKMKDGVNLEDMNLIKIALNPFNTVRSTTVNDKKCIEIKYGNEERRYFDEENKTPVKLIMGIGEDSFDFDYTFEEGVVTDEDVKLPEGSKMKYEKGQSEEDGVMVDN